MKRELENSRVHREHDFCLHLSNLTDSHFSIPPVFRLGRTFAISMCAKIASMIESLQTPISMKLQLIPVLRHMHHDVNTTALVKTLCINLLPKYPSENFVMVILDSLTQLSCATIVDVPDQVTLLLSYLQDPRKRIRYQVLGLMQQLARRGAHLWPKGALQTLISKAMTCT